MIAGDGHGDDPPDEHEEGETDIDGDQGEVGPAVLAGLMTGQAEENDDDQNAEDAAAEGHRGERVEPEDLLGGLRRRCLLPVVDR